MIETAADIQFSLQQGGDLLTFTGFTIYGIPESEKVYIDHANGISQIASKEYSYLLSITDCITHSIGIDTIFSTANNGLTYTLKVAKPYDPSGDGWARIIVNLTSIV